MTLTAVSTKSRFELTRFYLNCIVSLQYKVREEKKGRKSVFRDPRFISSPSSPPSACSKMDQVPHLDNTYGSLILSAHPLHLNPTSFPQVRCCFRCCGCRCSVSSTTRFILSCSDSNVFCAGYTEVILFVRTLDLHFSLTRQSPVACAQVFYYFQHYSKKDGLWIKAFVRPDKPLSAVQVLTSDRSLLP